MTGRILILGATGRLGRVAAEAFHDAGWEVASFARARAASLVAPGTEHVPGDATNRARVIETAQGADVILHALNPPLTEWRRHALPFAYAAIEAAETSGATLLFPGNVYNYGRDMPEVLDESTPMLTTSRKGELRIEIEQRIREATDRGMRAIVLRGGDFFGCGRGSWFDLVIARRLNRKLVNYPGPIDILHTWAYVPDFASALVRLAERRAQFAPFEAFGFPGHAVTGREFVLAIRNAVGFGLKVRPMTWWLIHALRPFMKLPRELSELAHLWNRPHRIDGTKLAAAIGEMPHTPLDIAIERALIDLGVLIMLGPQDIGDDRQPSNNQDRQRGRP